MARSESEAIIDHLKEVGNAEDAVFLQRYFKTGPGEHAEGDVFIGIRVPQTRKLARQYRDIDLDTIRELLKSEIHEARLLGLLVAVHQYDRGDEEKRQKLFDVYLDNRDGVNNWDLVDSSAEHIIGRHLKDGDRSLLHRLAESDRLWDRRIAVMATFHFIKQGEFGETLRLAERLLSDRDDLIHKAVGWMLREVGERDLAVEEQFLCVHYKHMPRTMLRYAIEKFPEVRRKAYLAGEV